MLFFTTLAVQAFEDCIIISDGKLTDIKIEDNSIIDVFPLTTIMNDKNTLIIHPLKTGITRFCVLKNGKDLALFSVNVSETDTCINGSKGFEILTLDPPEGIFNFELDKPPVMKEFKRNDAEWMN
jgi:hypothetical protein